MLIGKQEAEIKFHTREVLMKKLLAQNLRLHLAIPTVKSFHLPANLVVCLNSQSLSTIEVIVHNNRHENIYKT